MRWLTFARGGATGGLPASVAAGALSTGRQAASGTPRKVAFR